ncbi:type II secretion system protein GspE [Ferrigenium kumadai]|uniref:Type II secretion system protein E n=1 Tax=Ferrigenium kumadai TaxID=1682490 RepID=A0AAN1T0E9_9PROT|nr:type II secretion system ATPase GspE [Ferrigenium kumadai]BBJ00423.1 type II secretion system protein GspE [Ferrigenium kumadai]
MDQHANSFSGRQVPPKIPYSFAKAKGVLLTHCSAEGAEVQVRADAAAEALAEVRRVLGVPLRAVMLPAEAFNQALAGAYSQADGSAAAMVGDVEQDMDLSQLIHDLPQTEDLLDAENDAPVIRMINALLTQAVRENASDIHIEPFETRSVVRFRVDGTLKDVIEPHRALHAAMVSRIKIMAELDIAEKRLPQDGRITLRLAGRPVDVRVSTLPTGHGERAVLRLLDKDAGRLDLSRLGMDGATLAAVDELVRQPHGIVLVTGPTGSGKTTTLYAALSRIDASVTNVMTVEDPIEYDLDGIGQTQVNPRIDMSFARALRAILRQDPDVIMIGEIRDLETAQIAVQASLTGHLVLATLHTNDTASAVTRLTDMGVEPFLLSSSLLGVLAQRLVRCLCAECREEYVPDATELALLEGAKPSVLYRPKGCPACGHSGYRRRTGIYELLRVDGGLCRLIHDRVAEQSLREYAMQRGMHGLRRDGVRLVVAGVTSLEELLRVTRE